MNNELTIGRSDKTDIPAFNKIFSRYLLKGCILDNSFGEHIYGWYAQIKFTSLSELAEFSKAFTKECAKGLPTL